mgnify:CR=1 FL=1
MEKKNLNIVINILEKKSREDLLKLSTLLNSDLLVEGEQYIQCLLDRREYAEKMTTKIRKARGESDIQWKIMEEFKVTISMECLISIEQTLDELAPNENICIITEEIKTLRDIIKKRKEFVKKCFTRADKSVFDKITKDEEYSEDTGPIVKSFLSILSTVSQEMKINYDIAIEQIEQEYKHIRDFDWSKDKELSENDQQYSVKNDDRTAYIIRRFFANIVHFMMPFTVKDQSIKINNAIDTFNSNFNMTLKREHKIPHDSISFENRYLSHLIHIFNITYKLGIDIEYNKQILAQNQQIINHINNILNKK